MERTQFMCRLGCHGYIEWKMKTIKKENKDSSSKDFRQECGEFKKLDRNSY